MSVDLKARAAQAVELAQDAGAEDAWSTVSQSRDVQFEYRDGNLEKVKDTTSQSLGIRVYANGRYSSHATTDLNPGRLQDFIAEAVAITAALEPDELIGACRKLAGKIARNGPIAVRYAMEAVNRGLVAGRREGMRFEEHLFGVVNATDDVKEGLTAFLEKRAPNFKGA